MPKVGDKEFAYTPEGIAAAKQESVESGIPISDGATRNVIKYAGGGETGFNRIGINPMININQGSDIEGYNPDAINRLGLDPDVMDAAEAYYEKGGKVLKDKKVKRTKKGGTAKLPKGAVLGKPETFPKYEEIKKPILPKKGDKPKVVPMSKK